MHVVLVGGGMVGMFTSYYLLKDGHRVTLIDKTEKSETSVWNAGFIVPSFAGAPLIGMSTILAPYLGREGPVYISPCEVLRNMSWYNIASKKALTGYEDAVTSLGMESLARYQDFFKTESIQPDVKKGVAGIYLNRQDAEKAATTSKGRFFDQTEASEMGFKDVGGGVFFEDELAINPTKLFDELRKKVEELGAHVILGKEAQLKPDGSTIKSVLLHGGQAIMGDAFVLATGSWSRRICKNIGYDPQVLPARGLITIFETNREKIISAPAIFEDTGIAVSQHDENTFRLTGFFEMVDFKKDYADSRKEWLYSNARKHLTKYDKLKYIAEGVGYRPCTPDQLPVIGKVPNYNNLYIAAGHCRLGITLSPGTATMITSMINGAEILDKKWSSFDPARFVS
jgi:D-amino-acid dehydrogenase